MYVNILIACQKEYDTPTSGVDETIASSTGDTVAGLAESKREELSISLYWHGIAFIVTAESPQQQTTPAPACCRFINDYIVYILCE